MHRELRCTAKLFKRLHLHTKLPEPPVATNSLGHRRALAWGNDEGNN
jgi:hypothetical protein